MISRLKQLRRPNKKPLLILGGVTLGAIMLISGGWWYNAHRATSDYRTQVQSHAQDIKNYLALASAQFKSLAQEADGKKNIEALTALHDTLTKQGGDYPALPQLFGVTLTAAQDSQQRDAITRQLNDLAQNAKNARDLLAYEAAAASALQEVTVKTGANPEQQQALAAAWQTMAGKLKALSPPAEISAIHQQIVTAVVAVQAKLATLPDLFNKKDIPGFEARQKEIESHIHDLRAHGDAIHSLNVERDKAIARSAAKLRELLP